MLRVIITVLFAAASAYGQFGGGTATFSGATDPAQCNPRTSRLFRNTTSNTTKYCSTTNTWTAVSSGTGFTGIGTTLPATCTVGEVYFKSDATAGQNIYECAATNTWTQQLNSGAGGASTALDNLASVSINDHLLFQTAKDIGSAAAPARNLYLSGGISTGATPPTITFGTGGAWAPAEGTAISAGCPAVGVDCLYADSTAHAVLASFNNDTASRLARYSDKLSALSATTSAELATVLSDESGASGGFLRAGRTLTCGVGITGCGDLSADRTLVVDLSTLVGNQTLWDGSQASRTLTLNVSGTDSVVTVSSGVINVSTGALQVGGAAVLVSGGNAGTPSAINLGSGIALPVATGIAGLGTGVATALAANVSGSGAICLASGSSCSSAGGGGVISYSAPGLTLTANTYYAPPGGGGVPSTTEANSQVKSPAAGTVANFQVTVSAAPGTGNSYTFTWRLAGADQTLTCAIADTATTCTDTTHSFNVSTGDLVDVKLVSAGTIITTPMVSWLASWGTSSVGVTSVGFTGGLISVATATTTPALTVAGTSGGVPCFSSASTWTSSAALAANALVIGGGAGVCPSTTTTGTGVLTFLGTPSSTNLISAVTDETGSGALVFANTPTLVNPAIGAATGTSLVLSGSLTSNALTSTRVPIIGASGILADDADFTFATDTATITKIVATTSLTVAGAAITNNIVQNSQSAAYTTVIGDAGKHILHPTADNNARTFTIDSNANVAYAVGTTITFVNQINTLSIAITSDTLQLAGSATTGTRTLAAGGIATAIKITSTLWLINGTGLT